MTPNDQPHFTDAVEALRGARRVTVFSGAGVSAESGIPTFRDGGGLWERFPPNQYATLQGLLQSAVRRPREFAAFVAGVISPIASARPNAAHHALADAEQFFEIEVVTQNIDRLHQDAGSTIVHEVHGSLFEVITTSNRFVRMLSRAQLQRMAERLERLRRGLLVLPRVLATVRPLVGIGLRGMYRPNLVLFGESLCEPAWGNALHAAESCDLMIVVGTSGNVMPAAMLPDAARANGAQVITVDPSPPPTRSELWLQATASEAIPALVRAATI